MWVRQGGSTWIVWTSEEITLVPSPERGKRVSLVMSWVPCLRQTTSVETLRWKGAWRAQNIKDSVSKRPYMRGNMIQKHNIYAHRQRTCTPITDHGISNGKLLSYLTTFR